MYYYIMGIPFDDLWNKPELYVSVAGGVLNTTLEFEKATKYIVEYTPIERLNPEIDFLRKNYSDYTWCILIK